ncbi:metallophosphoesterase family protein [Heminiphilus faecis]|uniref:Phosphoesterase n=1 Tax=Heminiphilus faecis TaxID=2601703 RepID=A0ABV4CUP6_9BACT
MKRIGILSDTHSYWDDRYARYFAGCDEIWHAGDIGDITILQRLQDVAPVVRAVAGNIDHGQVRRVCREVEEFTVEGVKVWLTHIGGYPGRYARGLKPLLRDSGVKLMVDGHSHILKVMYDNELDMLHVNPGAAGVQGWQQQRTLVRLVVDAGTIKDLEVIELNKLSNIIQNETNV